MLKFVAKKGDFAKVWQKLEGLQPPPPALPAPPPMWSTTDAISFSNIMYCVITLFSEYSIEKRIYFLMTGLKVSYLRSRFA